MKSSLHPSGTLTQNVEVVRFEKVVNAQKLLIKHIKGLDSQSVLMGAVL